MEYLQRTEIRRLLKVIREHNPEHHLAFLMLYSTGTRVSQVLSLTGAHVYTDESTGVSKIRMPKAKRGKSRDFTIFKSSNPDLDLSPLVELAARRGSAKLFGSLSRQYMHTVMKKYAKLAGLPVDMLHCHIIRHTTAMHILNKTNSIGAVGGYLCHSNPMSAFQYVREHDDSIAENAMREELEAA
jgi:integrase